MDEEWTMEVRMKIMKYGSLKMFPSDIKLKFKNIAKFNLSNLKTLFFAKPIPPSFFANTPFKILPVHYFSGYFSVSRRMH